MFSGVELKKIRFFPSRMFYLMETKIVGKMIDFVLNEFTSIYL